MTDLNEPGDVQIEPVRSRADNYARGIIQGNNKARFDCSFLCILTDSRDGGIISMVLNHDSGIILRQLKSRAKLKLSKCSLTLRLCY
jgi:hypothetical protein